MLTQLRDSLDRMGRVMMAVTIALGVLSGLASSHFIEVTDQQWANVGLLTTVGATLGFAVDMLLLTPCRGWGRARKELAAVRTQLSMEKEGHARDKARLTVLESQRERDPVVVNIYASRKTMQVMNYDIGPRFYQEGSLSVAMTRSAKARSGKKRVQ